MSFSKRTKSHNQGRRDFPPSALGSNWEAIIDAALGGEGVMHDAARENSRNRRASRCRDVREPLGVAIPLGEAALVLGMLGNGQGWRRRVMRRLRGLEAELGIKLVIARSGRRGSLVSVEGLKKASPILFRLIVEVRDLRARMQVIERHIERNMHPEA